MTYSVYALIDVSYNENNVRHILKKGEELGFTYEDEDARWERRIMPLNIDESLLYILNKELPFLWVNYKETVFDIMIQNRDTRISIIFDSFGEGWKKRFLYQNKDDFYLQMYAKLMLDLVDDFKIIEFNVELS